MGFYVYILESEVDGSLYTGQTSNLVDRLLRHNRGKIRSTKARVPFTLRYFEIYDSRAEAMRREWEFKKQWNTERKKRLIDQFDHSKIASIPGL